MADSHIDSTKRETAQWHSKSTGTESDCQESQREHSKREKQQSHK